MMSVLEVVFSFFSSLALERKKRQMATAAYTGAHQWRRGVVSDVHDVCLPGPSDLYNILQTRSRQRLRL